jgi:hypothetical protein
MSAIAHTAASCKQYAHDTLQPLLENSRQVQKQHARHKVSSLTSLPRLSPISIEMWPLLPPAAAKRA